MPLLRSKVLSHIIKILIFFTERRTRSSNGGRAVSPPLRDGLCAAIVRNNRPRGAAECNRQAQSPPPPPPRDVANDRQNEPPAPPPRVATDGCLYRDQEPLLPAPEVEEQAPQPPGARRGYDAHAGEEEVVAWRNQPRYEQVTVFYKL